MMDLFFDSEKDMSFTIEVGYFDTIQEIKEKVSKYHGIPVDEQTLKFDGKTLPDDLNIHTSNILDNSRLKLITTTTTTTDPQQQSPPRTMTITKVKTEEIAPSPPSCTSSSQKIKILLKTLGVAMEVDMNDPVLRLKEKINEMEGIGLSRTGLVSAVYANGIELHDHKTLHECQLIDGSEVEIIFKPPLTTTTINSLTTTTSSSSSAICNTSMGSVGNYSKKLKVVVLSKCGEKISLEVNPLSNVGELRKELQKVRNQGAGIRLPEEGYFFIYKQNVMEEDQSFRWHRVIQGDTIEIFNGCVTGGS